MGTGAVAPSFVNPTRHFYCVLYSDVHEKEGPLKYTYAYVFSLLTLQLTFS